MGSWFFVLNPLSSIFAQMCTETSVSHAPICLLGVGEAQWKESKGNEEKATKEINSDHIHIFSNVIVPRMIGYFVLCLIKANKMGTKHFKILYWKLSAGDFPHLNKNPISFIWKFDAQFLFESCWIRFHLRKLPNLHFTVWETENQKLFIYSFPEGF